MRYLKQSTSVDVGIGPFLDETDGKTAETGLTITQPDVRLKKNGGAWAQKAAAQTLSHEEAGWYEVTLDTTDTDTIGILLVAVHESGALPVWMEFHVLAANVYDSLFGAATDKLEVDVQEINSGTTAADNLKTAGDNYSATRGLAGTALPNAAAEAAGGLYTRGTGAGQINQNANGQVDANATHFAGTAYATARAALVQAVWDALTTALTTVGSIGKKLADWTIHSAADVWASATRTLTAATNITSTGGTTVPQTGDSFARLGAPAGASVSADVAAVKAQTAAIETDTAEIGAAGAGLTALATAAALAAVAADLPHRYTRAVEVTGFTFFMRDSTTHTAATGLTVTAERSIDGGALAACANAVSEISNGLYKITLATTDMDGVTITLRLTAAGADDLVIILPTQPT